MSTLLSSSAYTAPPSFAVLFVKVEWLIVIFIGDNAVVNIAPPYVLTLLLVNCEYLTVYVPLLFIAPPVIFALFVLKLF